MASAAAILRDGAVQTARKTENGYTALQAELKKRSPEQPFLPEDYADKLPPSMARTLNKQMQGLDVRGMPEEVRDDYQFLMRYMVKGHESPGAKLNLDLANLVMRAKVNGTDELVDWGKRFMKKYAMLRVLFSIALEYINTRQWTLITLMAFYVRSLTDFTDCVYRSMHTIGATKAEDDAGDMHQALLNMDACLAKLYAAAQAFILHVGIFNDAFRRGVRSARGKQGRVHKVADSIVSGLDAVPAGIMRALGSGDGGSTLRPEDAQKLEAAATKWKLPQKIAWAVSGVVYAPVALGMQATGLGLRAAKFGVGRVPGIAISAAQAGAKAGMGLAAGASVSGVGLAALGGGGMALSMSVKLLGTMPGMADNFMGRLTKRATGQNLAVPFHMVRMLLLSDLSEVQGAWAWHQAIAAYGVDNLRKGSGDGVVADTLYRGVHTQAKRPGFTGWLRSVGGAVVNTAGAAWDTATGGWVPTGGTLTQAAKDVAHAVVAPASLVVGAPENKHVNTVERITDAVSPDVWMEAAQVVGKRPTPESISLLLRKKGITLETAAERADAVTAIQEAYGRSMKAASGWSENDNASQTADRLALMLGQIFGADPGLIYTKATEATFFKGFQQRMEVGVPAVGGLFEWLSKKHLCPFCGILDSVLRALQGYIGSAAQWVIGSVTAFLQDVVGTSGVTYATTSFAAVNIASYVLSVLVSLTAMMAFIALVFWFLSTVAKFIMRLLGVGAINAQMAELEARASVKGIEEWRRQIRREREDALATYKIVQSTPLSAADSKAFVDLLDAAAVALASLPDRVRDDKAKERFDELVNMRTSIATSSDAEPLTAAIERSAALHQAFRDGGIEREGGVEDVGGVEQRSYAKQDKIRPLVVRKKKPQVAHVTNVKSSAPQVAAHARISARIASAPDIVHGNYGITRRGAFRERADDGSWRVVTKASLVKRVPERSRLRLTDALAELKRTGTVEKQRRYQDRENEKARKAASTAAIRESGKPRAAETRRHITGPVRRPPQLALAAQDDDSEVGDL